MKELGLGGGQVVIRVVGYNGAPPNIANKVNGDEVEGKIGFGWTLVSIGASRSLGERLTVGEVQWALGIDVLRPYNRRCGWELIFSFLELCLVGSFDKRECYSDVCRGL